MLLPDYHNQPEALIMPQYREHQLNRDLRMACELPVGILAAVIMTTDGLLVTSYPPATDDLDDPTGGEAVAAMAAVATGLAEQTLDRLRQGNLSRVMIEGNDGTLVIYPATEDAALAILVASDAKLGLALATGRRLARTVRDILNG